MLEIYSRDRETDFEFFVFDGNNIKYKTIDIYELDNYNEILDIIKIKKEN